MLGGAVGKGKQNNTITQSLCSWFKRFNTTKVKVGAVQPPQNAETSSEQRFWSRGSPSQESGPTAWTWAAALRPEGSHWGTRDRSKNTIGAPPQCAEPEPGTLAAPWRSTSPSRLALSPWHESTYMQFKKQSWANTWKQTPKDTVHPPVRPPSLSQAFSQSSPQDGLPSRAASPDSHHGFPSCTQLGSVPALGENRSSRDSQWPLGDWGRGTTLPSCYRTNVWRGWALLACCPDVPSVSGKWLLGLSYTCYLPLCMSRFPHFPREILLLSKPPSSTDSSARYTPTAISVRTAQGVSESTLPEAH